MKLRSAASSERKGGGGERVSAGAESQVQGTQLMHLRHCLRSLLAGTNTRDVPVKLGYMRGRLESRFLPEWPTGGEIIRDTAREPCRTLLQEAFNTLVSIVAGKGESDEHGL
jgi:hypothetical protein